MEEKPEKMIKRDVEELIPKKILNRLISKHRIIYEEYKSFNTSYTYKLFLKADVQSLLADPVIQKEISDYREKYKGRKEAAQKAVETKREKAYEQISNAINNINAKKLNLTNYFVGL